MKVNKKVFIIVPLILAVFIFLGLFIYFNLEDSNSFTSSERTWIKENENIRYDFAKISDYPVYTEVFDRFIKSFEEATKMEFNVVNYNKNDTNNSSVLKFKIVKNEQEITDNDILLNEDVYVVIGKKEEKISELTDFHDFTIGVLSSDSGDISYYLKKGRNLTYKAYPDINKMFTALDEEKVDMIIAPNIMYLDRTIGSSDYFINYVLTEMSNKIVLSLTNSNKDLDNVIKKYFTNWQEKNFVEEYNEVLLDYYVENNNINSKTKADILSKTYKYGYVENYPYEVKIKDDFVGITGEYVSRIKRLTGIKFDYVKFDSIKDLKKAIENKEIDLFFNYYNIDDTNYSKTVSTFIEKYVILGKTNELNVVTSFESLKGKKVSILDNNALYSYFKDNSKANIVKYDYLKELLKNSEDNLLAIDSEVYNYYRNDKFKDYEVLFQDVMMNDYNFMVSNDYSDFYKLFNYIINTNSYYNYRNKGLNSLDVSILDQISFQELYIILIIIIIVPIIVLMILYILLKKKHKIKVVKKEERKKYTDMLTSLKNRNYLNFNIKNWNSSKNYPQTIIIVDLNNVNYVNDNYGYDAGDKLIIKAASMLLNTQLEKSEIIRTDGNEFLIYLVGYSEQQIITYTKKLSKEMKNLPYEFGAAIGYSIINDDIKTIEDAINEATIKMREDKEEYK